MIELRAHQQRAVEAARAKPNLALFYDAGTGKTGAMIRILAEEFNKCGGVVNTLIFAPLSVCPQWKTEFAKFSNIPPEKILVLTGAGEKRRKQLLEASQQACIVVTNYEAVQIKAFYDLLLHWSPEITVFDESHRIKDSQAKRSKAIYPIAHSARRRFLLTGTPVVNSLLDLFGQYKALDASIFGGRFWPFRRTYFYNKNEGRQFTFPEWVPYASAAHDIGKAISWTSLQAKREECLDLPPLSQIPIAVEMSSQQAKAYAEMKKDFMTEVNGWTTSSEFEMVKTLRMQQILAGFIQADTTDTGDKPVAWFKDQPRLSALLDIVDSIGKEQAIIWTTFKPTYKFIGEALEKKNLTYAFITGEQSQAQKQASIDLFKRGEAQFLIANPAAAAEGINLQEARYAIYYMRGYNLLHFLQSLARNYRSGTEKLHDRVIHYHIYAKGTLDEVIAKALLSKENVGKAVLTWAKSGASSDISLDGPKSNE